MSRNEIGFSTEKQSMKFDTMNGRDLLLWNSYSKYKKLKFVIKPINEIKRFWHCLNAMQFNLLTLFIFEFCCDKTLSWDVCGQHRSRPISLLSVLAHREKTDDQFIAILY